MKPALNSWEANMAKWQWSEALLASWEQSSLCGDEIRYVERLREKVERLRKLLRIPK